MAASVAKVAEPCGCFEPGGWPDVAVSMLLEGNEDPEIAELAGLSRQASGWDTDPLVATRMRPCSSIPDAPGGLDRHPVGRPGGWVTVDVTTRGLPANTPSVDAAARVRAILGTEPAGQHP